MATANNASNNSRMHHFKHVLLGDTAVGKTCLVVRFVRDEFFEFQEPTIGGKLVAATVRRGKSMAYCGKLLWGLGAATFAKAFLSVGC